MKALALTVLLAAMLSACAGEDHADLREWVEEQGRSVKGRVDPAPQVQPYEPFTYAAFDLPDPFTPRKIEPLKGRGGGVQPDVTRRREALEAYPLESLKMVGSLRRGKDTFGIVRTPEGMIYRVRPGNYMGQDFGLVTRITESEISVKEIVQDGAGDWTERVSTLQLLDEQEQKR